MRKLQHSVSTLLALILVAGCGQAHSPSVAPAVESPQTDEQYVQTHYTKREHYIPMRDGVRLFTTVYSPKDTSKPYPFLFTRTPYSVGPYGEDAYDDNIGPSMLFVRDGFIFVHQDVRGRFMSEGEFINMRPHNANKAGPSDIDESTDTFDTIEWLLNNVPNHNGRVGMRGISYPGFYASAGMIDAHPALKAVSPTAPIADWYFDDFFHHGAFFLPHAFNFFIGFGDPRPALTKEWGKRFEHGTPDGYQFFMDLGPLSNAETRYLHGCSGFWRDIVSHPNYDDFWQARNILPHLRNVAPAVMTVGGWFDAEDLYGALNTHQAVEKQNPGVFNVLVMGPWSHGGWSRSDGDKLGNISFGAKTAVHYRESVELPFFRHFLKDEGALALPEAYVFDTGLNRWRGFDAWPPPRNQKSLYCASGGQLSFDRPAAAATGPQSEPTTVVVDVHAAAGAPAGPEDVAAGAPAGREREPPAPFDEFISDPAKPVPFTEDIAKGMTREYMTDDQRFAARRPDVLVYQTDVLTDDLPVVGPIDAELWVSTTGTDADWIVKLIDVFPPDAPDPEGLPRGRRMGGYQMMVRSEVIRGRFRDGYETPKPFIPNEPARVPLRLQDVFHTFQRGHRLMIQVQSTWFPLVDRNPQKFVPNIFEATADDYIKATHRVYRAPFQATHIRIGLLN